MTRIQSLKNRFNNMTIRSKLVVIFIALMFIVAATNLYLFWRVNFMIQRMDEVYAGNAKLNDMLECLDKIENSTTEYLNTKSTDAMRDYYYYVQKYEEMIQAFDTSISSNSLHLKQKNIRCMSENYLMIMEQTIEAKRGRNVEKYKNGYEEGKKLYRYIRTAVYSLNNEQFKSNTGTYKVLSDSLHYVETISFTIIAAIAVVNILFIMIITRRLTRPLTELVKVAGQVGQGNFEIPEIEVHARDEIGVVSQAFNKMVASIKVYVETIRENMEKERLHKEKELLMEAHLKDAQLKYLQAQINPHFLFNTLNAGAQLAMMEEADRTYEYVQRVAALFRYNMKKNNEVVTLKEELDLIDIYIYILNVRFAGDIHFKKEIDESVLNIRVPSMILQPIVENSINYGIRDISWEGQITLSALKNKNYVYIRIKDNGIGISQSKIEKILSGKIETEKENSDSNGIGLGNVISRLKLFSGNEHVIEILSEGENMGTEVILMIPAEEEMERDDV